MLVELSKMEQRYDAVLGVLRDGFTVTEVAQKFNVSRQTVHVWLARYEEGGLEALAERSHRPEHSPQPVLVAQHQRQPLVGRDPAGEADREGIRGEELAEVLQGFAGFVAALGLFDGATAYEFQKI